MRKFLVILCGIMVTQAGFAEKRTLQTPHLLTTDAYFDAWDAEKTPDISKVSTTYSTDISGTFSISGFYNTDMGTWGQDEGSIIPIIAKKIYEHGGYFCMIQVQAANGSDSGYFIDYFMDTNGTYTSGGSSYKHKCKTVCEEGWSGSKCENHEYNCPNQTPPNVDYTQDLNNRQSGQLRITSGKQSDDIRITTGVDVFYYKNGNTSYSSYALVLGVVQQNKHSLEVAPVMIYANDHYIKWAHIIPDTTKMLCAPGYKVNSSGTDCERALECTEGYVPPCDSVSPASDKYDEDQHIQKEITKNGQTCWRVWCKDGHGFDPEEVSQGTCQSCVQGARVGVNATTGVCDTCQTAGEFFDDGQCRPAKYQISNLQMSKGPDYMNADNDRECWRESDIAKFKNCVMCDQGKCYDEEAHECVNCP